MIARACDGALGVLRRAFALGFGRCVWKGVGRISPLCPPHYSAAPLPVERSELEGRSVISPRGRPEKEDVASKSRAGPGAMDMSISNPCVLCFLFEPFLVIDSIWDYRFSQQMDTHIISLQGERLLTIKF